MKNFRRLCALCVIAGIFILIRYAMRDINLDLNLLRDSITKMPAVIIENISLEREIHGDIWNVQIPYMDREGERLNMRSLDIKRSVKSGGEWYFFGKNGVYFNDTRTAQIKDLRGTLEVVSSGDMRVWNLESPVINWIESEDAIDFPDGLIIYDSEFMLNTPEANINKSGVVLLKRGGTIQWTKPLQ